MSKTEGQRETTIKSAQRSFPILFTFSSLPHLLLLLLLLRLRTISYSSSQSFLSLSSFLCLFCSSLSFLTFHHFFVSFPLKYRCYLPSSDLKASLYDRSIQLFQRRIDMATVGQTNNDRENWDAKGFVRKTFLYEPAVERKSNVP